MTTNRAVGLALVAAGAVLALAFPDLEVLWFQGRPLGIVLVVLGLIDVATSLLSSSEASRGRLRSEVREDARELRDDLR